MLRSLSDINRSTAAKDLRASASFSAPKNPQCIPANTPPVFRGLRPRNRPYLLGLATKAMSDRLLNFRLFQVRRPFARWNASGLLSLASVVASLSCGEVLRAVSCPITAN